MHWYAIWTRSRAREGGPRPARRQGHRGLPAHHHPLEPLEGPQEAGRLAAVPRLLLRPLRRRGSLLPVVTCNGVAQVVCFDGRPAAVPDAEVEGIRTLVTSGLQYDPCPLIKEGAMVQVVSGPLQGRDRPPRSQGRACPPRAVGGSHRPRRERHRGRGGRQGVLTLARAGFGLQTSGFGEAEGSSLPAFSSPEPSALSLTEARSQKPGAS